MTARLICLIAGVLTALGLLLNPWITSANQFWSILFRLELLLAAVWLPIEWARAMRRDPSDSRSIPAETKRSSPLGWAMLGFIALLWFYLNRDRWLDPRRLDDDAEMFAAAADWETMWRHLLVPFHGHVVAPCRLVSYVVVQSSIDASRTAVAAAASILLFLPALPLLYQFARREWQSDLAGLLAVVLFSLTTTYWEIVAWFTAASQWFFVLHALLISLLVVQRIGRPPSPWRIGVATLLAAAAPLMFSIGVLVGPITSFWLLVRAPRELRIRQWMLFLSPALAGVVGTAIALVIVAQSAGAAATVGVPPFSFEPWQTVTMSAQLTVDMLLLRNLGIASVGSAPEVYAGVWAVLLVAQVLLWRRAPSSWRLLPFLTLIPLSYAITIGYRSSMAYGALATVTRYHLFAQLGASLYVVGALHCLLTYRFGEIGRLRISHAAFIGVLASAMVASQNGLATDGRFEPKPATESGAELTE